MIAAELLATQEVCDWLDSVPEDENEEPCD